MFNLGQACLWDHIGTEKESVKKSKKFTTAVNPKNLDELVWNKKMLQKFSSLEPSGPRNKVSNISNGNSLIAKLVHRGDEEDRGWRFC